MREDQHAELTASEANRIFYADEAAAYDLTEDCLCSPRQQRRLHAALGIALRHIDGRPQVLDACGGTGNVGVALHSYGIVPVVVDVSPDMTALWRQKAARFGSVPEIHIATVESFLASDPRRWDLITFASALHHLEDYTSVLLSAAEHLAPGGLIFTIFDPTVADTRMRLLRRADFALWLAWRRPLRFGQLLAGRLTQATRSPASGEHVGRMAERHAYAGIDDRQLVSAAAAHGMEVLVHDTYCDARLAPVRFALRRLQSPSSFHLVLRRAKPTADANP